MTKQSARGGAYGSAALFFSFIKQKSRTTCGFLIWSERRDLNPRPIAPEANALPDCATLRRRAPHHEVKVADSIRFPRRKVNGETSAAKIEAQDREAGKEANGVDVYEAELESFMVLRQIDESELKSA